MRPPSPGPATAAAASTTTAVATTATRLHAWPAWPARWAGLRQPALLLALVLAAHAALLLQGGARRPAASPGPAGGGSADRVQVVRVVQVLPSVATANATATVAPAPALPARAAHAARAAPKPRDAATAPPRPEAPAHRAPPLAPGPGPGPTPAPTPTPTSTSTSTSASTDADAPAVLAAEPADAGAGAAPPPLYPARPPPPVVLDYQLHYLGRTGQARLQWQPAPGRYQLHLTGHGADGRPLLVQHSAGRLGPHGLAPERFVDRRGQRGGRAANFQAEAGVVSFSGSAPALPLWSGQQDRLGWLVQLVAIQAEAEAKVQAQAQAQVAAQQPTSPGSPGPSRHAAPGEHPPPVHLQVVDARGQAADWVLRADPGGLATLDLPWGPVAARRWWHEPAQPDGLRVEVWLAPALGHWPVRLRYALLRTGQAIELLLAEPPAPGRAAPAPDR